MIPQLIRNRRGMSITEVMVGTAIASLLALGLGTTLYFAVQNSQDYIDRLDGEVELLRAEAALRNVIQTAVDVRVVAAPIAPGASSGQPGWIRRTYSSGQGGGVETLGHFYREGRRFAMFPPVGASEFHTTGLFFRPPSANGRRAGVLFIDLGGVNRQVSPDYSDLYIGNMVHFEIADVLRSNPAMTGLGYQTAMGITINMTVRYFTGRNATLARCFFRDQALCAGSNLATGRDVNRTIEVTFFNSDLGASAGDPTVRERPLGRIYAFPMILPTSSRLSP